MNVLIIESHRVFSQMLGQMLGTAHDGTDIRIASSMTMVHYHLAEQTPDLVFVDTSLASRDPSFSWPRLMARLDGARVVAVGGPLDYDDMMKAIDRGAADCLFRNLVSPFLAECFCALARADAAA